MTAFPDDLAQLFVPPNEENPPRYVIGVLEQWDPTTFQNVVRYRGAQLHNLAVMNGIEALSFVPGINVSLLGMSGTGALVSYAILGRYIDPGDTAAAQAIQALQSTVARELSAEIFAERIFTAFEGGLGTRNSTTYGNLSGASVGPELVDVPVSAVGRAIVIAGCDINCTASAGRRGFMSVEISGATTRAANDGWAFSLGTGGAGGDKAEGQAAMVSIQDGLNEGMHTFTAQFRTITAVGAVNFSARNLTVISF